MKDLLFVVGGASVVFGVYLAVQKRKKGMHSAPAVAMVSKSAPGLIVGPSITSSAGSANNNIDPVERYDASKVAMFPATTEIIFPGAGSLDGVTTTNMHQIVQF